QAHALDFAQLALGEAELPAPVAEDVVADGEAHARGDQGEETGPEEEFFVEAGLDDRGGRRGVTEGWFLPGDRHRPLDVVALTSLSPPVRVLLGEEGGLGP